MKKLLSMAIFSAVLFGLVSCKSEKAKGEDLIRDYMYKTAYDFDSYEPIETKVEKCNRTIWSNLKAIRAAKEVIKEYKSYEGRLYSSQGMDRYIVEELIKEHLNDFGPYDSLEANHYDGYTIDQRFRIKSQSGQSLLLSYRYIVSKDMKEIVESYELPENYINDISVGYVLNTVFDIYRSKQ